MSESRLRTDEGRITWEIISESEAVARYEELKDVLRFEPVEAEQASVGTGAAYRTPGTEPLKELSLPARVVNALRRGYSVTTLEELYQFDEEYLREGGVDALRDARNVG